MFEYQAGRPARRVGGERSDPDSPDQQGFAERGRQQTVPAPHRQVRLTGSEDLAVVGRQVVLEQSAATQHHEVGVAGGFNHRRNVAGVQGGDTVGDFDFPKVGEWIGDHGETSVGVTEAQPFHDDGQDGLVACVAEAVVAANEYV